MVETDELGSIESLLNHMDLDDEININNLVNTKIREGMWRWIESSFTNRKVKKFWIIEITVSLIGEGCWWVINGLKER